MGAPITEPEFDPELFDLRHVLDIALKYKRDHVPAPKPTGWRSSSLGYCMRRQFLERYGVEHTRSGDDGLRTLFIGDTIHDAVQRLVRRAGLLLAEELRLESEELDLTGHVDLIWGGIPRRVTEDETQDRTPEWGEYLKELRHALSTVYREFPVTGTELKTAHQYSAEKMFAEGPQFHHVMQAASYALLAEENDAEVPWQIDRWQITVLAKSNMQMPQFDILPTQIVRARERVEELNEWWKLGELPPCTCGNDISWEPRYCAYKEEGGSCCSHKLFDDAVAATA